MPANGKNLGQGREKIMKKQHEKRSMFSGKLGFVLSAAGASVGLGNIWRFPKDYFSWERFFTSVLVEETKDSYMAYAKRKINPVYLDGAIKKAILAQMGKVQLYSDAEC